MRFDALGPIAPNWAGRRMERRRALVLQLATHVP